MPRHGLDPTRRTPPVAEHIKAAESQWSHGKVHQLATLFSGETSTRTICGRQVYGERTDEPVDCSHCLAAIERRSGG